MDNRQPSNTYYDDLDLIHDEEPLRSRCTSLPPFSAPLTAAIVTHSPIPDCEPASLADDYFDTHPDARQRVLDVMNEYEATTFRPGPDAVETTRTMVQHFVEHPREEFHASAPFLLIDIAAPVRQMGRFHRHLPRVTPFYAMKCNPSEWMIKTMVALGASMDCASLWEIERALRFGVSPKNIIFANPQKTEEAMRGAERLGVQYTTFDSTSAVIKLKRFMPSCKAVLRIATNDAAAQCSFSTKFGARMAQVPQILECAKAHGVRVVGVAFHVGSGNGDLGAYTAALHDARHVFDLAIAHGFSMNLLDLGGGLPGHDTDKFSFEEIAATVAPLLDELFPDTTVIAEPGRYFAAGAQTVVASVFGERDVPIAPSEGNGGESVEYQYYIEDGAYHSFNCLIFDHAHPTLHRLHPALSDAATFVSTVWGPTCDSMDVILRAHPLPRLLDGEWLFFPNMGAYTTAAATAFNGFGTHRREFVSTLVL